MNPGSQRNNCNNRGIKICSVIAYDHSRTDTALFTGFYVMAKIDIINISTFTHFLLLSAKHIIYNLIFIVLIQFLHLCNRLSPVIPNRPAAYIMLLCHLIPCQLLKDKIR